MPVHAGLNDDSNRLDKRGVIQHDHLNRTAVALNMDITESAIVQALKQFTECHQAMAS